MFTLMFQNNNHDIQFRLIYSFPGETPVYNILFHIAKYYYQTIKSDQSVTVRSIEFPCVRYKSKHNLRDPN